MARPRSLDRIGEARAVEALTASLGNVSDAARHLGVSSRTIHRWLAQHPHLRQLVDAERDRILDKAEQNVFEAVERGDLRASWFVLRTLGKDRGYAERTEVDQSVPTATQNIEAERLLTMVKPVLIEENREGGRSPVIPNGGVADG
jgi:transposase-like protein